ncbi:MAG: D-glycerate dehydrogenase [Candidatus Nomurabacteria bacterium]|nr:D-glycerate dehydrogenase [Candidatus Nomurabacteria bacterium]
MSKLIYITRAIGEVGVQIMKDNGYTVDIGTSIDAPSKDELIKTLSQKPYDALVSFLTDHIDKDVFDACPTIKIVANYAVGFNNINLEDAKERGIVVTNTPGCSSRAVAEHAIALILSLTTRATEGDEYIRSGKFTGWSPTLLNGVDLSGKTIGILGGGAIGQEVASILHFGFNCPIIYSDIKENEFFKEKLKAAFVDKETLLKTSDIVSLHVPLLPTTKHLINKESLSLMKKDAFLINTSRGPVIDEVALVEALKNGVIKGAGLDVFEFEPAITEGLEDIPDVVLTPHIASSRASVRLEMTKIVGQNVVSFFEKGQAINPVN